MIGIRNMIDIVDIKNAKYLEFYSNDGCIYCKNKTTDEVVLVAEDEKYKILKKEYLDYQKWYREEKNKNIKQKEIVNQLINAIKTKLKNSDNYEMGLENSSYKDRLFTETYIELQVVLDKLKEVIDEI